MSPESIIDTTKPNAGRMYDYYLGGSHNFDVDRQAAEQMLKLFPFIRQATRLQRWTLQDLAVELTTHRGYEVIIDFASGLPTNDHLHYKVPPGTMVIYSDYDPVVVEYAHQILGHTPNVYFFNADVHQPEELLQRDEVQRLGGNKRRVAFVTWEISVFISDAEWRHAAQALYEWAAPGSCWAFNAQGAEINTAHPAVIQGIKIYEQMGTPVYPRTLREYEELLKSWQTDAMGFVSLLEWHGFDQSELGIEDAAALGPLGSDFGAYLIK